MYILNMLDLCVNILATSNGVSRSKVENACWYHVPVFLGHWLPTLHPICLLHPGLEDALPRHFRFLCSTLCYYSVSLLRSVDVIIIIGV